MQRPQLSARGRGYWSGYHKYEVSGSGPGLDDPQYFADIGARTLGGARTHFVLAEAVSGALGGSCQAFLKHRARVQVTKVSGRQ